MKKVEVNASRFYKYIWNNKLVGGMGIKYKDDKNRSRSWLCPNIMKLLWTNQG